MATHESAAWLTHSKNKEWQVWSPLSEQDCSHREEVHLELQSGNQLGRLRLGGMWIVKPTRSEYSPYKMTQYRDQHYAANSADPKYKVSGQLRGIDFFLIHYSSLNLNADPERKLFVEFVDHHRDQVLAELTVGYVFTESHSEAYRNRRLAWGKVLRKRITPPCPNEILTLVSMPVTPVQYIHHLVVGYVARHVVTVHDIAHASLHARHLVAVICPPILLPA